MSQNVSIVYYTFIMCQLPYVGNDYNSILLDNSVTHSKPYTRYFWQSRQQENVICTLCQKWLKLSRVANSCEPYSQPMSNSLEITMNKLMCLVCVITQVRVYMYVLVTSLCQPPISLAHRCTYSTHTFIFSSISGTALSV